MGSAAPNTQQFTRPWVETPCLYSAALSKTAGCNIFLKLENHQPSGSFKSRGIGNLMVRAAAKACEESGGQANVHFYCSSGGNAGLACATAARGLNRPATIVVPTATSPYMVGKLREICDDVRVHGANWAAADQHLREEVMNKVMPGITPVYVPPFDHPDIWDGAASLVEEVSRQLPAGVHPDAFVCSVGGGGLLCGLMQGIEQVYGKEAAQSTKMLAVETAGAESLAASVAAGELVTLPGISSIATSLGCIRVAERTYQWYRQRPKSVVPVVVSDAAAVDAIVRFLDDTRLLVEPACGAALAPLYTKASPDSGISLLRQSLGGGMSDVAWAEHNVVMVVCGGSNISLDILAGFRERFGV
ncbi:catabolic L-serine/threonine dehydratase [Sporothrix eucalyptigena]|uniref:L-serine ammonia-lyase n=1 Tax=Sporothrix eucalyptigena TaxID=1812306 RepID=A0ABP0BGR2_9PEZI